MDLFISSNTVRKGKWRRSKSYAQLLLNHKETVFSNDEMLEKKIDAYDLEIITFYNESIPFMKNNAF